MLNLSEVEFAALFFGFIAISFGVERVLEWRRRREPCRHGVQGGNKIPSRCAECRAAYALRLAGGERGNTVFKSARAETASHKAQRAREARESAEAARVAAEEEKAQLARDDQEWRKETLRAGLTEAMNDEFLHGLSGRGFQELVWLAYRCQGYAVTETPAVDDGGVDGFLEKDGESFVLQCKRHRGVVGPAVVRELYGTMLHQTTVHEGTHSAILVTTGTVSRKARGFCEGKRIGLVDHDLLPSLFESAKTCLADIQLPTAGEPTKGICPRCANALRLVRPRSGARPFIGCSAYPECRYSENAPRS